LPKQSPRTLCHALISPRVTTSGANRIRYIG
jgi:hypothetical protein